MKKKDLNGLSKEKIEKSIVYEKEEDESGNLKKNTLQKELPNVDIFEYPNISNFEKVEAVILWKHPQNILSNFSNCMKELKVSIYTIITLS